MAQAPREDTELPVTDKAAEQQVQQQFQSVQRILTDPDLQPLRSRIQLLFNNFVQQVEMQKGNLAKCTTFKKDKQTFLSRIANCNKMIDDENSLADNYKKQLEKRQADTEELKKKEQEVRDLVTKYKHDLAVLERESIKLKDDLEIRHESQENDLKKELEEQKKVKDEFNTKLVSLRTQEEYGMQEISDLQKKLETLKAQSMELTESINDIQMREMRQKANKEQRKDQLNRCKQRKDEFKQKKLQLQQKINKLQSDIIESAERLKKQKKDKDEQMRIRVKLTKQKQALEKEHARREEELEKQKVLNSQKEENLRNIQEELAKVMEEKEKEERFKEHSHTKVNELLTETELVFKKKEEIFALYQTERQALEDLKLLREKNKNQINDMLSRRLQSDKLYKSNKNEQHQMESGIIEQLNKLKKVTNQVTSYQAQSQKLAKIVDQLKKQQQKYGIQASAAHLKYFQTIEQVKIKNAQIQSLQKDNQDVQNKCKHQQNLYQAVRSDRNLYSKQFHKSSSEISELKSKYNRMVSEVGQLREEIKNKDQDLIEHDREFRKIRTENIKIEADQARAETQMHSTEEVIRNQENHIGHLKKIIQEAKAQKVRQQKDYDMVVNQRDILGTQLIKKNQELAVLYEKIKLSNSNLTKADLHYKKLQKQFNDLQRQLAQLRNQYAATDDQIKSIDDLKSQVSFKQKQLLNQRTKVRALEDELANPMNVHRWRKLEATDQENYERILKIQTLQRRLIAKTEEVQSKENLIREKEKLFLELKNILSRQPGAEIHEQLATYREKLKEKAGQMKKMKNQLEASHSQVQSLQYQINRLKNQMASLKRQYFELRSASQKEVFQERDLAKEMLNLNQQQREANNMSGGIGIGLS